MHIIKLIQHKVGTEISINLVANKELQLLSMPQVVAYAYTK